MGNNVKLSYRRSTGIAEFEEGGAKYMIPVLNDDLPGAIIKFYEMLGIGCPPGEVGMKYHSIMNLNEITENMHNDMLKRDSDNEKLDIILKRLDEASKITPEDIDRANKLHRELSRMTPEDYFIPIGKASEDGNRDEQYEKMMKLKTKFDEPMTDEQIDERELLTAQWEAKSYENMLRILK